MNSRRRTLRTGESTLVRTTHASFAGGAAEVGSSIGSIVSGDDSKVAHDGPTDDDECSRVAQEGIAHVAHREPVHAGRARKRSVHAATFAGSLGPRGTKPPRVVVPTPYRHRQIRVSGPNRWRDGSRRVSLGSLFGALFFKVHASACSRRRRSRRRGKELRFFPNGGSTARDVPARRSNCRSR